MVMKKINKNQTELGIKTYDFNVPEDHISRFVVDFVEECFPILGIKEKKKNKKKGGRPSYHPCSMLKRQCCILVGKCLNLFVIFKLYFNLYTTNL